YPVQVPLLARQCIGYRHSPLVGTVTHSSPPPAWMPVSGGCSQRDSGVNPATARFGRWNFTFTSAQVPDHSQQSFQ
ncbi:MAG: hypothetical protein AAF984_11300, partial [Verrucomicrobiota bacterium]